MACRCRRCSSRTRKRRSCMSASSEWVRAPLAAQPRARGSAVEEASRAWPARCALPAGSALTALPPLASAHCTAARFHMSSTNPARPPSPAGSWTRSTRAPLTPTHLSRRSGAALALIVGANPARPSVCMAPVPWQAQGQPRQRPHCCAPHGAAAPPSIGFYMAMHPTLQLHRRQGHAAPVQAHQGQPWL